MPGFVKPTQFKIFTQAKLSKFRNESRGIFDKKYEFSTVKSLCQKPY